MQNNHTKLTDPALLLLWIILVILQNLYRDDDIYFCWALFQVNLAYVTLTIMATTTF